MEATTADEGDVVACGRSPATRSGTGLKGATRVTT